MDAKTRDFVRQRAGNMCEYCGIPQQATPFIRFHVEHIIARQHREGNHDDPAGLALACDRCNAFKGPNLSSNDTVAHGKVDLFHPRFDDWDQHFSLASGRIKGLTDVGRATARLLNMNDDRRVELRLSWKAENDESATGQTF